MKPRECRPRPPPTSPKGCARPGCGRGEDHDALRCFAPGRQNGPKFEKPRCGELQTAGIGARLSPWARRQTSPDRSDSGRATWAAGTPQVGPNETLRRRGEPREFGWTARFGWAAVTPHFSDETGFL